MNKGALYSAFVLVVLGILVPTSNARGIISNPDLERYRDYLLNKEDPKQDFEDRTGLGTGKWINKLLPAQRIRELDADDSDLVLTDKRSFIVGLAISAVSKTVFKAVGKKKSRQVADDVAADDVSRDDQLKMLKEKLQEVTNWEEREKALAEAEVDIDNVNEEPVVKSEKFMIASRGSQASNKWFRKSHYGVVVTVEDGRRLLIIKGFEFFRTTSTSILDASVMTDAWQLVDSKDLTLSWNVGDFFQASETSYNSLHAVDKMMALG